MLYGRYYSTTNLLMPTKMVLSSNAMMASIGESSLGYLHTQQTTLRSACLCQPCTECRGLTEYCRVLLATIRDKGSCPCPWCLVPKVDFHHVGLLSDMSQRISKVRSYLREKIATAWATIYNTGAPIKGSVPEAHLKEKSLVPTFVSQFVNAGALCTSHYMIECVHRKAHIIGMQYLPHSCC